MALRHRLDKLDGGWSESFGQDDYVWILDALDQFDPMAAIRESAPDLAWYVEEFLMRDPGYIARRQALLRIMQPRRYRDETAPPANGAPPAAEP
jgi:hypothetical protein